MKKVLITFIMTSFLLSGCSLFKGTPFEGTFPDKLFTSLEKKIAASKSPAKPEELIADYYNALKKEKYTKAVEFHKADNRTKELLASLEKYPVKYNSLKVLGSYVVDEEMEVQYTLDKIPMAATFIKEENDWKIERIWSTESD